jgi:hypothetical protein
MGVLLTFGADNHYHDHQKMELEVEKRRNSSHQSID